MVFNTITQQSFILLSLAWFGFNVKFTISTYIQQQGQGEIIMLKLIEPFQNIENLKFKGMSRYNKWLGTNDCIDIKVKTLCIDALC